MTLWNASAADRTHSWDVTYTAHREFSKVSKNSLATPRTSISEKSHDDESDVFPFLHSGPQVHGNGAHKGERQTSPLSRCGNVLIASFTPCSWHTVPTTEYYIYDDDGRNNKHWNSKLKRRRRTVNRTFFFLFCCVSIDVTRHHWIGLSRYMENPRANNRRCGKLHSRFGTFEAIPCRATIAFCHVTQPFSSSSFFCTVRAHNDESTKSFVYCR